MSVFLYTPTDIQTDIGCMHICVWIVIASLEGGRERERARGVAGVAFSVQSGVISSLYFHVHVHIYYTRLCHVMLYMLYYQGSILNSWAPVLSGLSWTVPCYARHSYWSCGVPNPRGYS